jgi:thiamine-monophosphate kinase
MTPEFRLIDRFFSPATDHTLLAGGDDAALLVPTPGAQLVISTDMLVEGVHFLPDADAEALGHKTLAVNLSDLAAMGARPRWAFVALALPTLDESWCERFMAGFLALAGRFDVDLAGGDTTRGPRNLCVTIVGECAPGAALRRDAARVGDDIHVSGVVGEAAAGLWSRGRRLAADAADVEHCRHRLDRPEPRVALGRALAGVAHAAIDVSDGLVADLGHICSRSGLGATIEWSRLPHSSALAALPEQERVAAVLSGGDDYELVFTAPVTARESLSRIARDCGVPLTRIGRMHRGEGVSVQDRLGRPLVPDRGGFDHFA